ncbi:MULTISPECIES: hypothetical protein [unclassified Bacillus (in: firmicutes)]|uniref:hypothetical protein n=1 Tax=unclassified Bacillus (in: firmicutes) TaxID=185979 RepID=UPI0008E4F1ED|nr:MULTISPECIES: hypothetical protein [unclassified Bacillus (in: firmicutes)]SFA71122.1 hypothetical protein SAMN02799634_101183 [Bacillus sp. UNCCL13]SFQ61206.1 hypothetical protein SAMN04488577_0464 [Bacillus sp. cl95]
MMEFNHIQAEYLMKVRAEEMKREMTYKEKYRLYEAAPRQKVCVNLKIIKFCF